jgi:hypothetical protein
MTAATTRISHLPRSAKPPKAPKAAKAAGRASGRISA